MFGVAVGDALGATVEFLVKEEIQRRHGRLRDIIGGGWLRLKPGEWTDDTEMTLAVAKGILINPHNPLEHIGRNFLYYANKDHPAMGLTTRAVISNYRKLKNWYKAAEVLHKKERLTAGNGALMRTLPVAFMYKDPADIFMMSMAIARMTHWDPEAGLTCCLYCLLAREFISGTTNRVVAWEKTKDLFLEVVPVKFLSIAKKLVLDKLFNIINLRYDQLKPGGYNVDSLECALSCFLREESFEDAVVSAVNLGGDADTIGIIYCAGCPTLGAPKKILKRVKSLASFRVDAIHLSYCMTAVCPFINKYIKVIKEVYPEIEIVEGTHKPRDKATFQTEVRKLLCIENRDMTDLILSR